MSTNNSGAQIIDKDGESWLYSDIVKDHFLIHEIY